MQCCLHSESVYLSSLSYLRVRYFEVKGFSRSLDNISNEQHEILIIPGISCLRIVDWGLHLQGDAIKNVIYIKVISSRESGSRWKGIKNGNG